MRRGLLLLLVLSVLAGVLSADETSPDTRSAFVRSFADSSVDWMPWGEEAFARAIDEDKPVFLFIGAFTSELSRAMRDQSFEQVETVELLNGNFICVLVDREQEPQLAAWYQGWLRSAVQLRGWPLNLWLTPELKPFDGANYLPPSDEWGNVGYLSKLKQVMAAWSSDPAGVRREADRSLERLLTEDPSGPLDAIEPSIVGEVLSDFSGEWMSSFDPENGGFGSTPRHPRPELLRSLLLSPDEEEKEAALFTLRAIAVSGLRDPLDGGFFRYASDEQWMIPYFQKTLSDQARMALAYLDAAAETGDDFFGQVAALILEYALGQGRGDNGYSAAEDGTPEAILPGFFWSLEDVRTGVGTDQADTFCQTYSIFKDGNLPPDAFLSLDTAGLNLPRGFDETGDLAAAREALLGLRQSRSTPLLDSAAGSGPYGLLLMALSRAGSELGRPDFVAAARKLSFTIQTELVDTAGLLRAGAGLKAEATAREYLLVSGGLLAFADASEDGESRIMGRYLLETAYRRFGQEEKGRFLTSPAGDEPGIWGRIPLPAPDTSGLPSAEAAFILTVLQYDLADEMEVDLLPCVAAMVGEMEMSAEQATGDQLLALRAAVLDE